MGFFAIVLPEQFFHLRSFVEGFFQADVPVHKDIIAAEFGPQR